MLSIRSILAIHLGALLLVGGCAYELPDPYTSPQTLGGEEVGVEVLAEGQQSYMVYCAACHGLQGDGRGDSAPGLDPPPRDFRSSTFKFAGVSEGELPHDEDLARIVDKGLAGTVMLHWEVGDEELHAILQYIKTFAPEGEGWRDPDMEKGERVVAGADPWAGKTSEAVERGKAVYHGSASCFSCHPAYENPKAINAHRAAFDMPAETGFRSPLWMPEPKVSETYSRPVAGDPPCDAEGEGCAEGQVCVIGRCEQPDVLLPPDFTFNEVRNGSDPAALYRVIAAGVPGTAMPRWKGSLPEEDIWAMAHYVAHLMSLSPKVAAAARDALKQQIASP